MLHQVGVGALGPVFRTYEPTRDRLVAVKVFRLDITPEQAESLADELSKAAEAGLFHPSVVEPIAAGVEGTVAYRAEEYVAAETLDVAMRHYAPAPVEKVLPFVTQLAGAIDFARTAGVGHGALHPRDIFVTPEEARASGFGVVEALERVGLRAPVRRPYTAPERVAGGTWGTPADVFSLAVVTYELLTGRRPSGMGAQIGTITGDPHAAAIHAVLAQAIDESPARRHQSALAFASALDAASRGETAPAIGAAAVPPADLEEAAEMPRDETVDARDDIDDIAAERDEDEAHIALTLAEQRVEEARIASAADLSLFDEEAVEDHSLDPEDRAETERFADEFAATSDRLAEPVADPIEEPAAVALDERYEHDDHVAGFAAGRPVTVYDQQPVLHERRGPGMVPIMTTAVLALLVGFAAGYAIGTRSTRPAEVIAGSSAGGAVTGNPPETAKPYSEQAVTPPGEPRPADPRPAGPPQPSGEAPPVTGEAVPPAPAPAGPPETPVATSGRVEVRSTPPGAGVTVDGDWRGRTPLTLEKLRFGRHTIRVLQPGFTPAREEVTLSSTAPSRELSFRLERSAAPARPRQSAPPAAAPPAAQREVYTGSIYVDSRPRGARVLVDGKFMGTTPVRIADMGIGSHVVRLQLADHRDWTSSTRVTAGQESRVTGSLERNR